MDEDVIKPDFDQEEEDVIKPDFADDVIKPDFEPATPAASAEAPAPKSPAPTSASLAPEPEAPPAHTWESGDGGEPTLPVGEKNQWGGNLRTEGRKPLIRRDSNGKVNGYSTTTSMFVKHDDGRIAVVPTVIDGVELSTEDAAKHYADTGEYWGMANNEEGAKKIARAVHDEHQKAYQEGWNNYIQDHWDDMGDEIRRDPGVRGERARRRRDARIAKEMEAWGRDAEAIKGYRERTKTTQVAPELFLTGDLLEDADGNAIKPGDAIAVYHKEGDGPFTGEAGQAARLMEFTGVSDDGKPVFKETEGVSSEGAMVAGKLHVRDEDFDRMMGKGEGKVERSPFEQVRLGALAETGDRYRYTDDALGTAKAVYDRLMPYAGRMAPNEQRERTRHLSNIYEGKLDGYEGRTEAEKCRDAARKAGLEPWNPLESLHPDEDDAEFMGRIQHDAGEELRLDAIAKLDAGGKLSATEQSVLDKIVKGGIESGGYALEFALPGGAIFKGAQALNWGAKAVRAATMLGSAVPVVATEAASRYQENVTPEYGFDDNGEFKMVAAPDDEEEAAYKAIGGAIFDTAVEVGLEAVTMGLLRLAGKATGWLLGKATPGAVREFGVKRFNKFMASETGQALRSINRAYQDFTLKTGINNPGWEWGEENVQAFEKFLNLDGKTSEHKGFAQEWQDFKDNQFNWQTQWDIFYGLIAQLAIGSAKSAEQGVAQHISSTDARRDIRMALKRSGISDEAISTLTPEQQKTLDHMWRHYSSNPDELKAKVKNLGISMRLAADELLSRESSKMAAELKRSGIEPEKFVIQTGEDGKPAFQQMMRFDSDGSKVSMNAMTDVAHGVTIVDQGNGTFHVMNDWRGLDAVPAYSFEEAQKKADEEVLRNQRKEADNKIAAQRLMELTDPENGPYRGRKVVSIPSEAALRWQIADALRRKTPILGITRADQLFKADGSLKQPGAGGFHTPDGHIVVILDNVPSPAEMERVLAHEATGHEGVESATGRGANTVEFIQNAQAEGFSKFVLAEQERAVQRFVAAGMDKATAMMQVAAAMSTDEYAREAMARYAQGRLHRPTWYERRKHELNQRRRGAGENVPIDQSDLEVMLAEAEAKGAQGENELETLSGDSGVRYEEGATDEAGNGADEAQPQQADENAGRDGQQPPPKAAEGLVEVAPPRAEAPDAGVVEQSKSDNGGQKLTSEAKNPKGERGDNLRGRSYEDYAASPEDGGTADEMGAALMRFARDNGGLLKMPPKGVADPMADWIDAFLDGNARKNNRGEFIALFGMKPKTGANDAIAEDMPSGLKEFVEGMIERDGPGAVADWFLETRRKYREWAQNRRNAAQGNATDVVERYDFDELAAAHDAMDEEFANALGVVEGADEADYAMLTPASLQIAKSGDTIRFDHDRKSFVFGSFDAGSGVLVVYDEDVAGMEGGKFRRSYRVTENSIEEIDDGQGNEVRADADRAGDEKGPAGGGGEAQGGAGRGAGGGAGGAEARKPEDLTLDSLTPAEWQAEQGRISDQQKKAAAREDMENRRTARLKGSGAVNVQPEMDLGQTGQQDLFSPIAENEGTPPAAKEKAAERPAEYLAWLERYKMKDTDRRFAEWQRKQAARKPAKTAPASAPRAKGTTTPPKSADTPQGGESAENAAQRKYAELLSRLDEATKRLDAAVEAEKKSGGAIADQIASREATIDQYRAELAVRRFEREHKNEGLGQNWSDVKDRPFTSLTDNGIRERIANATTSIAQLKEELPENAPKSSAPTTVRTTAKPAFKRGDRVRNASQQVAASQDSPEEVVVGSKEAAKYRNTFEEGRRFVERHSGRVTEQRMIDPKTVLNGLDKNSEWVRGNLLEGETWERVVNMPTTQKYIQMYKDGSLPPPVSVIVTDSGKLRSLNRRRIVAAIEAGVTSIPANVETGERIATSAYTPEESTQVKPLRLQFKRGDRVFLRGAKDGQRVTFLKANADGTADVQVRTPGANRYVPEKVETRTVPMGEISSTGMKDTLTDAERNAYRRGVAEQTREAMRNDPTLQRIDAAYRAAKTDAERNALKAQFAERVRALQGGVNFDTPGIFTGTAADYANRSRRGGVDDGPSVKHIGTGEGSQVYGWGLYGSTVRGVADRYAKNGRGAGGKDWIKEGRNHDELSDVEKEAASYLKGMGSKKAAIERLKEDIEWFEKQGIKDEAEALKPIVKELLAHGDEYREQHENVYEQTFFTDRAPGDESHLLKWYEPVTKEQLGWIVSALKAKGVKRVDYVNERGQYTDALLSKVSEWLSDNTGHNVYVAVARTLGSPQAASEFLYRAGIDGVKYPVDSYGGKGVKDGDKAGWNYVAFSDEHIRVDHKWTDGVLQFDTPELSADYSSVPERLDHSLWWISTHDEQMRNDIAALRKTAERNIRAGADETPSEMEARDLKRRINEANAKAREQKRLAEEDPLNDDYYKKRETYYRKDAKELRDQLKEFERNGIGEDREEIDWYTNGDLLEILDSIESGEASASMHFDPYAIGRGEAGPFAEALKNLAESGNFKGKDLERLNRVAQKINDAYKRIEADIEDPRGPFGESLVSFDTPELSPVTPADDAAYMDAVRRGDMETAGRMVREAARAMPGVLLDEEGNPKVVYHGTNKKFTVFDKGKQGYDPGFFFAENRTRPKNGWTKEYAEYYGGNVMGVFLSNPEVLPRGEYRVNEPSQIKSADPVTYDDAGNVIPLSQRFNQQNEDIRFDTPELTPAEAEYAASGDKTPTEKVMREVYGMTNDEIATALKAAGMEPPAHVRKTDADMMRQAETLLSNPTYMAKLSRAVAKFPRPIRDYENVALNTLFRQRKAVVNDLEARRAELTAIPEDDMKKTPGLADKLKQVSAKLVQAKAQMGEAGKAAHQGASEQGSGLRSNRVLINAHDYSYAGISGEIAENVGGAERITPEMDARIRDLAKLFEGLDAEGLRLATERLIPLSKKIIDQTKNGLKVRKATERKVGDVARKVAQNYQDALTQIEVGAVETGGTLIGLSDQQYPSWGKWLRQIGEFHCFLNPEITEEEMIDAIVRDISPFMEGVDANQVRDALTGFGHNYKQSRYDAQRLMNSLRNISRSKRQIDWMDETNTMPPATGPIRDEPTQDEREWAKRVRDRKAEVPDAGRDERRLKGILDSAKTRVRNRIADLKRAIETGEKIPTAQRKVVEDIELREMRKEKDELQKQYDELFGTTREMTDAQRIALTEKLLAKELERAMEDFARAQAGDFSKRPQRPGVTSETIETLRDRIRQVRESIRELKSAKYAFGMTPEEVEALNARKMASREKALARLAERIATGDIRPQKKPQPPMTPDQQKRYDELGEQQRNGQRKLRQLREDARRAADPEWKKAVADYFRFFNGQFTAHMASFDRSAVMRQALRLTMAHPLYAAKAMAIAEKTAWSRRAFDEVNGDILADPVIQDALKYGLKIRSSDVANVHDVEMFSLLDIPPPKMIRRLNDTLDRIPLLGRLYSIGRKLDRAILENSERHYVTYINLMVAQTYRTVLNAIPGATEWQKREIAQIVNMLSGAGAMSEQTRAGINKLNDKIGHLIWSPNLWASQIQQFFYADVLHPMFANREGGKDGNYRTKAELAQVMKEAGKLRLRSELAILALGAMLAMFWSDDDWWEEYKQAWKDGRWWKALSMTKHPVLGKTHIDLEMGQRTVARFVSQFVTGEYETSSGRMVKSGDFGGKDLYDMLGRIIGGKLSPVFGTAFEIANRKSFTGEPLDWPMFVSGMLPLTPVDVVQSAKEDKWSNLQAPVAIVLTILGAGGNVYDEKYYERAVNRFLEAKKEYDAIQSDDSVSGDERSQRLSDIREGNPLMRDEVRGKLLALKGNIAKLERNEKTLRENGASKKRVDEVSASIAKKKVEFLDEVRKARGGASAEK